MSRAKANEELLCRSAESVIDMRDSIWIDPGDNRWVRIHIPEVRGVDQGGSGCNHFFVQGAIESYRDFQVSIGVVSIAACLQSCDDIVACDDLFFEDRVVAIDAVEKVVGTGFPVKGLDHMHVIGMNLLRWCGYIASVGRAEIVHHARMRS